MAGQHCCFSGSRLASPGAWVAMVAMFGLLSGCGLFGGGGKGFSNEDDGDASVEDGRMPGDSLSDGRGGADVNWLADLDLGLEDVALEQSIQALEERYPSVAAELWTLSMFEGGPTEEDQTTLAALVEVLDGLEPDELDLALLYLLSVEPSCRADLAIEVDGDFSEWPEDAWLELGPSETVGGLRGERLAVGTDGEFIYVGAETTEQGGLSDPELIVEIDTAWGALSDFGFSLHAGKQSDQINLWHVDEQGNIEGRINKELQGIATAKGVEWAIPIASLVPRERPVVSISVSLYDAPQERWRKWTAVYLVLEPTLGALEDLCLLLSQAPEGLLDPRASVALAIQDRVWTYWMPAEFTQAVRGKTADMLEYALELPHWLDQRGLDFGFPELSLYEKLHWAWRNGNGAGAGGLNPYWRRESPNLEWLDFWTLDADDLAWYRSFLVEGDALSGGGMTRDVANAVNNYCWSFQFYATSPETTEFLCELGTNSPELCESYEEDWYGDGVDLGPFAGMTLKLWEAPSAHFQIGVFEERGQFFGDCGTNTAIMNATLRSVGLATIAGSYHPKDTEKGVGHYHVYPVYFDVQGDRWYIPQDASFLEQWGELPAGGEFVIGARHGFSWISDAPAGSTLMGGPFFPMPYETYVDVVDHHATGFDKSLLRDFVEEDQDVPAESECPLSPDPSYLNYSIEGIDVPMSDGTELVTYVYRPTGPETMPAILDRSIWGWTNEAAEYFVSLGYAYVIQLVRGRYDSDGQLNLFVGEKGDGHDAVEWILAQPWSDGQVATVGAGYSAFTALAAATHPAVKAAVVENAPALDPYLGWPGTRGRLLSLRFINWLTALTSNAWPEWDQFCEALNHRPMESLGDDIYGVELPFWKEFLAHFDDPADSAWRKELSLADDITGICAAVLHLQAQGHADDGPLANYRALAQASCNGAPRPQGLVFGTRTMWDWYWHGEDEEDQEVRDLVASFLAAQLGDTGSSGLDAKVMLRHPAKESWELRDSLEPDSEVELLLSRDQGGPWGILGSEAPEGPAFLEFVTDPATNDPCDGNSEVWFSSEPFSEQVAIAGEIGFELSVSVDVPDADIIVTVYEQKPDNTWHNIASGGTRLAYRDEGEPSSTPIPGQVIELSGALRASLHLTDPGSRIHVTVAASSWEYLENPNTGGPVGSETETKTVTVQVHLGPDLPGRIALPLVH